MIIVNALKALKIWLHYPIQAWKGYNSSRQTIKISFSKGKSTHHTTATCWLCTHSGRHLNIIQGSLERDPLHNTLYHLTTNGWPSRYHAVPHIAKQSWGAWDKLPIDDGLLKRHPALNPPNLHGRYLAIQHQSYICTEKLQKSAQSSMYWPGIDPDIRDYNKHFPTCIQHKKSQKTQSVMTRDVPW